MRTDVRWPGPGDGPRPSPAERAPGLEDDVDGPVLLLEVGSTATRATLLDTVEGRYRFVASALVQTTVELPVGDVMPGIRSAVGEVERTTRRRLLDSTGLIYPERPDGGGLSTAVVTAGQPLHLALVRLAGGLPLAQARSALDTSGVLVVGSVDVDDLPQPGGTLFERLQDVLGRGPDVILVLGPREVDADGPAGEVGQRLAKVLEQSRCARPAVLFVGASDLAARLEDALGECADFRTVRSSPSGDEHVAIRSELRGIWRDRLADEVPGYSSAQSWVSRPMVPSAEAFATALRFLARRRGCQVWGVDVGSSTSCLIRASAESATIHVAEVGIARRTRWALADGVFRRLLPEGDQDDLRDILWNRSMRPWSVPETPEEQSICRALTREAIQTVRRAAGYTGCFWRRQVGLVVARGGGLYLASQPAEAAWAVAEGLRVAGVFELALDRHEMLPGLGALASVAPQAAAEALLADGLAPLATIAVAEGSGQPGGLAARAELRYLDGRRRQTDVLVGQVASLPLRASEVADLTLSPAPGFDFGWGNGKPVELRVRGGAAGLLIGVRTEPAASGRGSRSISGRLIAGWRRAIGATGEG